MSDDTSSESHGYQSSDDDNVVDENPSKDSDNTISQPKKKKVEKAKTEKEATADSAEKKTTRTHGKKSSSRPSSPTSASSSSSSHSKKKKKSSSGTATKHHHHRHGKEREQSKEKDQSDKNNNDDNDGNDDVPVTNILDEVIGSPRGKSMSVVKAKKMDDALATWSGNDPQISNPFPGVKLHRSESKEEAFSRALENWAGGDWKQREQLAKRQAKAEIERGKFVPKAFPGIAMHDEKEDFEVLRSNSVPFKNSPRFDAAANDAADKENSIDDSENEKSAVSSSIDESG
jgi:hypothetical protein